MSNLFKLHVYLKQPKDKQSSLYPVYMRITMDGKRVEISTKKEADPNKWNKKAGKMDGNSEKVWEFNAFLDRLIGKIYAYQNEILQNNLPLSPEAIKNMVTGKGDKSRMLVSIFENHNKEMSQLVGKEYSPST